MLGGMSERLDVVTAMSGLPVFADEFEGAKSMVFHFASCRSSEYCSASERQIGRKIGLRCRRSKPLSKFCR